MQIACPNCAAEYTLDERLLPVGGAPVQCTSCNHVFTATAAAPGSEPPRPRTGALGKHAEPTPASPRTTQIFAAPPSAASAPANQTMRFGALGTDIPKGTLRFAAEETAALRNRPRTSGAVSSPPNAGPQGGTEAVPHLTQTFGAVEVGAPLQGASSTRTLVFGKSALADPTLDLGFGKGSAGPREDLAPGVIPGPDRLTIYEDRPPMVAPETRRLLLRGLTIVAALAAIAFVGIKVGDRLRAIPAELISQEQSAFNQLRLDDPASRKKALAQLDQVIARAPRFLEPKADRVLLLALSLDDLRAPLRPIDAETASLEADIRTLSRAKTPSDWEVRVNALRDRKAGLARERSRIAEDARAHQADLDRALASLPLASEDASPQNLAVIRARAVSAGVEGTGAALELAERYGTLGDPGGWSALALAEYALNANAPPETVEEVRTKLRDLKSRDPAFLRPYVLLARLDLTQYRRADALSELEAVVALNPDHALARRLLGTLGRTGEDGEAP